jgi:PhzF family phenazine biosynthesis protein
VSPAHPFRIVNVFTQEGGALTGNPLCVFENGEDLDTAAMQALALQFNLSETTFILPSTVGAARVRIFTPTFEMPFAGHPTLGTAQVCRAMGLGNDSLELEMRAGLIPVAASGNRWTLTAPAASWREVGMSRAQIAAALGLEEADIGERPLWGKAGKEQLIVPLESVEAVHRAVPRPDSFAQLQSEDGLSMAYVFAQSGAGRLISRFFFQQGAAVREDPATGSAAANLGAWHLAMQKPLPVTVTISQGEHTGRPSTLYLNVDSQGRILVGGDVIEIGSGTISLG